MRGWRLLSIFALLALIVVFGFREYQTRRVFEFSGQISSCRYEDAFRDCNLFIVDDGKHFLLTEGSVLTLKKIDRDIARFYNRPVKISAHILGQKIGVEGKGNVTRIDVVKFEI